MLVGLRPDTMTARLTPADGSRAAVALITGEPAVRSTHAGGTPAVEATLAFSAPTSEHAQFPGLLVAAALNAGRHPTRGAALVAEADLSAYRYAFMAGPRAYRRSSPLSGDRATITYFSQIVAGAVSGEELGVVRSVGGFVYQPGIGIDYGRGFLAGRGHVDYSVVPDGYVVDEREPGRAESLTRLRIAVGMTFRSAPW